MKKYMLSILITMGFCFATAQNQVDLLQNHKKWKLSTGMGLAFSSATKQMKSHLSSNGFGDDNAILLVFSSDYPKSSGNPITFDLTLRYNFKKEKSIALMAGISRSEIVTGFRQTKYGIWSIFVGSEGIQIELEHSLYFLSPMYMAATTNGKTSLFAGPTVEFHTLAAGGTNFQTNRKQKTSFGLMAGISTQLGKWIEWVNAFHYSPNQTFDPTYLKQNNGANERPVLGLAAKKISATNFRTGLVFYFSW